MSYGIYQVVRVVPEAVGLFAHTEQGEFIEYVKYTLEHTNVQGA